ncbi:MAG: hypothetical protein DRI26_00590 [Chloroflexi bacterium]|nr:MAG: hypothetical protein DRI26_00590 [Chloroflexota bacterium]
MILFDELIIILLNLVSCLGYGGLFIVMFLAGLCAPIPWELVLIPAGASGLNPITASISGGLGSSLGATLGYWLGRKLGRQITRKYGKYLYIEGAGLETAKRWIIKWGSPSTIIFRSVQYLPYKTFNLAAGTLNMDFFKYITLTIIGSTIRCLTLVYLGKLASIDITTLTITILVSLLVGCLLVTLKYVNFMSVDQVG